MERKLKFNSIVQSTKLLIAELVLVTTFGRNAEVRVDNGQCATNCTYDYV